MAEERLRTRETRSTTVDRDLRAIEAGGLEAFIRAAWRQIEPRPFLSNWHIGAIAAHLEAVAYGWIRRLVINQPPGTMKSTSVGVMFPLWVWATQDPAHAWIYASYSAALARRDGLRTRNLIESAWWKARFPHVYLPKNAPSGANDYAIRGGGWRYSTSVGGAITGRHADTLVIDDPIKPREATLRGGAEGAALEIVREWYRDTLSTRQKDPQTGRRILVMQRVHEGDLAGMLEQEGGWEFLRLPMSYEPSRAFVTFANVEGERVEFARDPRTEPGELLWPERFPPDVVAELTRDLGAAAPAQLEQTPTPVQGATFQAAWFERRWKVIPAKATWIQSWDLRFKDAPDSGDYVVGQVWAHADGEFFLVDQVRGRWSFEETCAQITLLSKAHPKAARKLVENKANGPAVVSALKRKVGGLVLVEPEGGKEARAAVSSALFEAGNVLLPESAPWLVDYIGEHIRFPRGIHDDQVDTTSQALAHLYASPSSAYREGLRRLRSHGR